MNIVDREAFLANLYRRELMFGLIFPTTLIEFERRYTQILNLGHKGHNITCFKKEYNHIVSSCLNHYYFTDFLPTTCDEKPLSELAKIKYPEETHRSCSVCYGSGYTIHKLRKTKTCQACHGSKIVSSKSDKGAVVNCQPCNGKGSYPSLVSINFYSTCYLCRGVGQLEIELSCAK
jgi:DnaJ-class molecular chaperone